MFDDIQPTDSTDTETAARNTVLNRQREVQHEIEKERDARIVELIKGCETALSGTKPGERAAMQGDDGDEGEAEEEQWGDRDPDQLLTELGALLEGHPDVEETIARMDLPQRALLLWQSYRTRRNRAQPVADLLQEHAVYATVARHAGLIGAYTDRSSYAPVRLEALNVPGASSNVDPGEQTPIGRRRVSAASTTDLDDETVTLPLKDCRHMLVVADPRQGKDSTICRIAGNLKDEHGYKWISIYDDGRNENRMIHIPNDEKPMRQLLREDFSQEPVGYETRVYVPATDLPTELPDNHVPFSVSVDDLTPDILAWLAGIKPGGQTEQRLSQALQEVQDGTGGVSELINQLRTYAQETTARVTVERPETPGEGGDDIEFDEYEMSEDSVLMDIVEALTLAAGQGIIRDRDAETNIDMHDILAAQDRVAALNANHVDDGLKHLCVLIWMALIWEARGDDPSLPRVAIEAREIKNLAPSKNKNSRYKSITDGLHQVLYLVTTQGSARRVMLLGSVQKLRDFEKSLRSNMDIMLLLKIKSEKINELNWSFSREERRQLRNFQQGWGMIAGGGEEDSRPAKVYPLNFAPARCGLGLGDVHWMDRYAVASGWRVADGSEALDEWINGHGDRVTTDDATLTEGDWYLHPEDVEADESVREALERRMRDGMPSPVMLHDPSAGVEEVDMELLTAAEQEAQQIEDLDLPPALEDWLDHPEKIERWLRLLRTIEEYDVSNYREWEELSGVPDSTITEDASRPVGRCWDKEDGQYCLTGAGERALDTDWTTLTRA